MQLSVRVLCFVRACHLCACVQPPSHLPSVHTLIAGGKKDDGRKEEKEEMFRQQQELLEARRSGRTLQDASARRQKVSVSRASRFVGRCTTLQSTAQHSTARTAHPPPLPSASSRCWSACSRSCPEAAASLLCCSSTAGLSLQCGGPQTLDQQGLAGMAVVLLLLLVLGIRSPLVDLCRPVCAGDAS